MCSNQHSTFLLICHADRLRMYEDFQKMCAALSYNQNPNNMTAAVLDFRKHCKGLGLKVPADAHKFVKHWGQHWNQHGNLDGRTGNCGRKPALTQEDAELLVAEMMSWQKFGLTGPFVSLKQLQTTSPLAKAILDRAAATPSTIIRALKKIEPKLAYRKLTVKQKLSKQQRADRLRVATHHISVSDRVLECVVWIDAKTMYMTIKTRCGWIRVDDGTPFETTRPASKKNPITLRYYIGVCARAGAVFLMFYTGTTGMKADRDPTCVWLVS